MKVALIADWLTTYAGAEKVIEQILEVYPKADVFATIETLSEKDNFLKGKETTTSFLQKFPFIKKKYRSYLPLMPLAIESLDVSNYDLIISSSHCIAKGIITGPDQIHISYVHSPIRYAWDLQHQYLKENRLNKGLKGFLALGLLHYMRLWDCRTANGVDKFIANSNFIAKRIEKTYRRQADVVYPPVDVNKFKLEASKEDFYLTASRMVPYKRIDLIVEAFTKMPDKKLIVIGDGPDFKKISEKASSYQNITLMGYQNDDIMKEKMRKAKAFVFAALEDFGIVPVEAQACGTPVIAYGKGGCLETVNGLKTSTPTGVFFYEQNIEDIIKAVNLFEENQNIIKSENCRNNALKFSIEQFRINFKNIVNETLKANN